MRLIQTRSRAFDKNFRHRNLSTGALRVVLYLLFFYFSPLNTPRRILKIHSLIPVYSFLFHFFNTNIIYYSEYIIINIVILFPCAPTTGVYCTNAIKNLFESVSQDK